MNKNHIFIWQSGEPLPIDKENHNPMRAINLSNFLLKNKFKITLISSNFDHTNKKFRYKKLKKFKILKIKKNFSLVLINSIGYSKNISLQRLIDHFQLALNLNFFLKKIKINPNAAFIGFPPIEPAIIFSKWLLKRNIPYFFDIKDLWPEYFYERISKKFFSICIKFFFFFHDFTLKKSLIKSSGILASSNFFLNYTLKKINKKKSIYDQVIYLTKPIIKYKSNFFIKNINLNKKIFNIYFCGRINLDVFDFRTVFEALRILNNENFKFHFYVAGYGELNKLQELIDQSQLHKKISLIGFVNKYDNSLLLKNMDVFIAPFLNKFNFSSNLSNKFIDSIQYNLPILTPLNKEVSKFLLKNKIGLIYKDNNSKNLATKIKKIKDELKKNKLMRNNLINLSKTVFNHEKNYSKILNILKSINLY